MGEKQNGPFQLSFNATLNIDFQGSRVMSHGDLILVRGLDERLGFSELINRHLVNRRQVRTQSRLWRTCFTIRLTVVWHATKT